MYQGYLYHTRVFFPFSTPKIFLPSDEDLTVVDLPCTVHFLPSTSSFLGTVAPAAAQPPQLRAREGLVGAPRRPPSRGSGETLPRPRLGRLGGGGGDGVEEGGGRR